VLKPRGVPHAFWNAGDRPARLLEIISPAGFEQYFRDMAALFAQDQPDRDAVRVVVARYGLDIDHDTIPAMIERYGLEPPAGPARNRGVNPALP
jgi:hypothetical protein